MVAVEDLMIGEIAVSRVVVDKAGMNGPRDADKVKCVTPVMEDSLDSIQLFRTVAQDVKRISVGDIPAEVVGYEVEVLMPFGLRCSVEVDDRACIATHSDVDAV